MPNEQPKGDEPPTLYVLDGSYYIFRAFHALRHLSNSKGLPTNGLYAFTGMLLKTIRDRRPTYMAIAFDPPGPSFRHERYPEYKANRKEMPEELVPQMPWFREIVRALRIPILEVEGYEADDVIATLVKRAEREGIRVVILSGDKDLYQVLDDQTIMIDTMRDKVVTVDEVRKRFNVAPERVPDVQALAGDSSDNVPGVPGIGEKTAGKLIARFGGLEELLAHVDEVPGTKRRENLRKYADQIRLARRLTELRTDVPIDLDLESLRLGPPDFKRFDEIAAELEFNRFPAELREIFSDAAAADADAVSQAADFDYQSVLTEKHLEQVIAEIREAGRMSFDLETTSLNALEAKIVGVALASKPGHAVYVPVAHRGLTAPAQLSLEHVLGALGPLIEDPELGTIGQHTKYEITILRRYGLELRGVVCDTMLAAYLLDPNRRRYKLDVLALEYLHHRTITYADVAGRGKKARRFDEVEIEAATRYAAEDADVTLRLADVLLPQLEETGQRTIHDEIEVPLAGVLARMEATGIRVDTEFLARLSEEFAERLAAIEARIFEAAGERFAVNSPKQLAHVLFDRLGLPVIKRGKTGPSTDQSVLERLAEEHPLPRLVLSYRQLQKLKSTYVDALPKLVNRKTGRIHTDFNQAVAATGRLSSSNPNLQNIPVRTEEGRRIREAFVPEPGCVLMSADYSQVELRLLAHMSGDEVLIDAFRSGQDIHARTAAELFEVPLEEVSREQRSAAKAINFGLIYGMGANRLAAELGIAREEAARYIERYFERLPKVRPFLEQLKERARERGYAETLFGRRRPIPQLNSTRGGDIALGERLAINTPIQGTAADIIKLAMIRIDERLSESAHPARMLLQVHDELVFELPPEALDETTALVREEMEGVLELAVPLVVDIASGPNWAALK